MLTDWGKTLDVNNILQEYPRPQMVRDSYLNLNGYWDYAITTDNKIPSSWDGLIVVPFSPESELSGVNKSISPKETLWYRRTVNIPENFNKGKLLLNFGAVDQVSSIYINGEKIYTHVGGFLPFTIELNDSISDSFEIIVEVKDETDEDWHTRGKQKTHRGGIWYTPQSGIWQTVWLESVPKNYIKKLYITPIFDNGYVEVEAEVSGNSRPVAIFNETEYPLPARIMIEDFVPWSPENPKLYSISVSCDEDNVESYFAMRKISIENDSNGIKRIFLNNCPYFQNGLLDQGYWSDGLYTAPSDEALIYDILTAKEMGFNMLRKHIKVEPLRWYYHCDRLGMLVWQDMPCGGGVYSPAVVSTPLVTGIHIKDNSYFLFGRAEKEGRDEFERELKELVNTLYNCPSICLWVIFNEGWGQFDASRLYEVVRKLDPYRLIDHASGWHDQKIGDLQSLHVYFKKYTHKSDKLGRAVVLSEFGGYNHRVLGHTFNDKDFGYKKFESPLELEKEIESLYKGQIIPAIEQGLSACVYTQLSDVEDELNGLLTYDRKVTKIAATTIKEIFKEIT